MSSFLQSWEGKANQSTIVRAPQEFLHPLSHLQVKNIRRQDKKLTLLHWTEVLQLRPWVLFTQDVTNFQEFPESAWYPHFVKLTYQGWGQAVGTLARVIMTYSECVRNAAAGKPFAPVLFSTWGTWKNTLIWHCSMNLHVQQGCVLTIIISMNLKIHSFQIQYYCTSGIQLI